MQSEVPANAIARVAAYSQLGTLILAPLGYAVVGFIAQSVGVPIVLWTGAIWIAASTAVVIAIPSIRRYRPPLAATVAPAGA
jgi:hypothetical protein